MEMQFSYSPLLAVMFYNVCVIVCVCVCVCVIAHLQYWF